MQHKLGLYIRVSTEEQAMRTEGSLESQKHRLLGYVDIKNLQSPDWAKVVEHYVDEGFSAKDTNRPGLQRMLKDLRSGKINMVLVTDLSRLSRSIRDFCGLLDLFKETKAKFLSLKEQFDTSSAAGEMMLFNMINLAQFERRQISERVSMNFHSRALRGLRNGGAAVLGFSIDPANKSVMKIHEQDASSVRVVFDTFIKEGSLYRAAARLREMGIPTRPSSEAVAPGAGSVWNTQLLLSMLRNYSYAGLREVNKGRKFEEPSALQPHERYQVVKAAWPAIIDDATFFTVQKMLDENAALERKRLSKSKNRTFTLTGLASCGECGRPLVGSTGHGRLKEVRYYIHRPLEGKPVTCEVRRWRADDVEDMVANHLTTVIERTGYLDGLESSLAEKQGEHRATLRDRRRMLERTISQTDQAMRKLVKLQLDEEDRSLQEIYSEQLKEAKELRETSKVQLRDLEDEIGETLSPEALRKVIEVNLKEFQRAWGKAHPALRKQLLRSVLAGLVFKSECIEIFYHSDRAAAIGGPVPDRNRSVFQRPVDFAGVGTTTQSRMDVVTLGVAGQAHYAKVSGWYIGRSGCGGWI